METVLAVIVFIVLVYAIYKLPGKAVNFVVNNTVARGANVKGKQLTQQVLSFSANAPIDSVRNAVLDSVQAQQDAPTAIAKLYLAGVSRTQIVYDHGSKLQTGFRGVLNLAETSTGTRGTWEITNWLEQGGLVTHPKVMERLISEIDTGLRSADPNAHLQ